MDLHAGKLAPALSTRTKVNLLIPSCFICGKSLIVFSYCPAFTYLASLLFHENCSFAQSLVPLQLALLLPMEGSICHRAIVPPMSSYVWNWDTLHSPTTREQTPAHHLCIPIAQATQTQTKKRVPSSCINERFWTWMGTFTFSALWSNHCDGYENNLHHCFSTILF